MIQATISEQIQLRMIAVSKNWMCHFRLILEDFS